jgi:hypothetical protein
MRTLDLFFFCGALASFNSDVAEVDMEETRDLACLLSVSELSVSEADASDREPTPDCWDVLDPLRCMDTEENVEVVSVRGCMFGRGGKADLRSGSTLTLGFVVDGAGALACMPS